MVDGCCWTPLSFANLSLPSPRDVKPKRPSARNSSGNFASGETKITKRKVCAGWVFVTFLSLSDPFKGQVTSN